MNPKRRIIPLFIPHAGCPHACVFCNQRLISGAAKPAGADDVRTAVSGAGDQPAELAFYGGSFTAIPEAQQNELLSAAAPFLSGNPENSIRISTRPDYMDEATAARLRHYGVRTVELGAQSMCDDVLMAARRGHLSIDVVRAARIVKDAGLSLILQMMTGLPGDTRDGSLYTAERFIAMEPNGVRIYPAVVVSDTELYEIWRRGEYIEHTVEDAVSLCAVLCGMFGEADIPVIRLGLNATDELSAGDAVAGAYHPAFGELVYSRIYLDRAMELLAGAAPGSDVTLGVAKGRVSIMTGQRRRNIAALMQKFSLRSLKVIECGIGEREICGIIKTI